MYRKDWFALKNIITFELHCVLYVMCACLVYLLIAPLFMNTNIKRKMLFVYIMIVITTLYILFEKIDSTLFVYHSIPSIVVLVILFEGSLPGIATYLAFNTASYYFLNNDLGPALISSTLMSAVGIYLNKRLVQSVFWYKGIAAIGLVSLYFITFFLNPMVHVTEKASLLIVSSIGTYLSTLFICYIYYHVKRQEKMKEELINAEKFQLIGQLAASISHEIRNPLTTTRGFLQLLSRDHVTPENKSKFITLALEGIDSANTIITDYLNFAKPNVEKIVPIDIKTEISNIIPLISSLLTISSIEMQIQHSSDVPLLIQGESKKLQQCLLNLLKNCIESMPSGGYIIIHTSLEENKIHLSIEDTGVGMTPIQIKSLGLPFYTTKEKGTGLGLMVVTSLLKAMNGKISFISKPNKGTTCLMEFKRIS
jgi:two-component system sporulation sensor kinase B